MQGKSSALSEGSVLAHQPSPHQQTPSSPSAVSHCVVCGRTFGGKNKHFNLQRHIRTHTGEKPFACPFCPHRATQKVNLKSHVISQHGREKWDEGDVQKKNEFDDLQNPNVMWA